MGKDWRLCPESRRKVDSLVRGLYDMGKESPFGATTNKCIGPPYGARIAS